MTAVEMESYVDPIKPVSLTHSVDAGWRSGSPHRLEFFYNFLDYVFDVGVGQIRARFYLDEPREVAVHFLDGATPDDRHVDDVITYLRWRFRAIKVLTPSGYQAWPGSEATAGLGTKSDG